MKNFKKYYKWLFIGLIVILFSILLVLVYNNFFKQGVSNRLDGIDDHKLTSKEIDLIEERIDELDVISSIGVSTKYKIIKIFIELKEDIELDDMSKALEEAINNISEKNLKFYDVEIFIESLDEESEIYPKIGYKHKTNSSITWNR